MIDPTRDITAAIARGDPVALERLYRERFDFLYAAARTATRRDESFCLDIVHDAMLRVIKSMKPIDTTPQLEAWLRKAILTAARDRLRAETRRARRESAASEARPAAAESAIESSDHAERLAWLTHELNQLDASTRELLSRRHAQGWTLARIAAFLGMKPGAVDARITRATAALRARAPEHPDD